MVSRVLIALVVLALSCLACEAVITLPSFISNGMVLQRGRPVRIWGKASAGAAITATLSGRTYNGTVAGPENIWEITIPPHNAAFNLQIALRGDGSSINLQNVAFGDVFFCSGQSNMELDVAATINATEEIADSNRYTHLRLFSVAKNASLTTEFDVASRFATPGWLQSGNASVGGAAPFNYFSATCYYFGRDLYRHLNRFSTVTVGLVESCWGGTRVEAWTSTAGIERCGNVSSASSFYAEEKALALSSEQPELMLAKSTPTYAPNSVSIPDPNTVSVLYNAMVHPFLRYSFVGSTWYQGEANSGNATNYACRFPVMIEDWRRLFEDPELSFDFVLLAPYQDNSYPALREAQLVALILRNTGVANVLDYGDLASPWGSIHPRFKQQVGNRLARGVIRRVYASPDVVSFGPFADFIDWPNARHNNTVLLRYDTSLPFNAGLHLVETEQCVACCNITASSSPFEFVLTNNKTVPADFTLSGRTGEVTIFLNGTAAAEIEALQFVYQAYPQCIISNDNGLPGLQWHIRRPRDSFSAEIRSPISFSAY